MASLRDIWMCFALRRGGGTRIQPPWVGEGMIGIFSQGGRDGLWALRGGQITGRVVWGGSGCGGGVE
jgi:hypothetical protein